MWHGVLKTPRPRVICAFLCLYSMKHALEMCNKTERIWVNFSRMVRRSSKAHLPKFFLASPWSICMGSFWPVPVALLPYHYGAGLFLEWRLLWSTIKESESDNFLIANSYPERGGKYFQFVAGFEGKKGSGFYDLHWGRGLLVSVACLLGGGCGWGVRKRRAGKDQREILLLSLGFSLGFSSLNPHFAQKSSTAKDHPTPNISLAEAEKPPSWAKRMMGETGLMEL